MTFEQLIQAQKICLPYMVEPFVGNLQAFVVTNGRFLTHRETDQLTGELMKDITSNFDKPMRTLAKRMIAVILPWFVCPTAGDDYREAFFNRFQNVEVDSDE